MYLIKNLKSKLLISITYRLLFIPMKFFKRIQIFIEYLDTPNSLYSLTLKKLFTKTRDQWPTSFT